MVLKVQQQLSVVEGSLTSGEVVDGVVGVEAEAAVDFQGASSRQPVAVGHLPPHLTLAREVTRERTRMRTSQLRNTRKK